MTSLWCSRMKYTPQYKWKRTCTKWLKLTCLLYFRRRTQPPEETTWYFCVWTVLRTAPVSVLGLRRATSFLWFCLRRARLRFPFEACSLLAVWACIGRSVLVLIYNNREKQRKWRASLWLQCPHLPAQSELLAPFNGGNTEALGCGGRKAKKRRLLASATLVPGAQAQL